MQPAMPSTGDNRAEARGARAFFGRRKGHRLRPQQTRLLETLLPRLAVDLQSSAPADLRDLFPESVGEVRLEIGFGGGEHMLAEAAEHSRSGIIGSEAFINGMAKALAGIAAQRIGNVRLHLGDVALLMPWLPRGSLSRVDLIYPDPWPKRRHWKRRFVQEQSLGEIARVLRPGGEFRFVTDVADYAAWTLRHVAQSAMFEWTAERADDWRLPWAGFGGTRYEAKAKQAGRVPSYLIFRRI